MCLLNGVTDNQFSWTPSTREFPISGEYTGLAGISVAEKLANWRLRVIG